MRTTPSIKYTKIVRSEGSEISRSLQLARMKCVEIRIRWKAKYLMAQLLKTRFCELEIEVKLKLARLQINENVGTLTGLMG